MCTYMYFSNNDTYKKKDMNFCMIHVYQNSPVSGIREILNIVRYYTVKMMHWRKGSYMIWFYEKEKLTTWSIKLLHC